MRRNLIATLGAVSVFLAFALLFPISDSISAADRGDIALGLQSGYHDSGDIILNSGDFVDITCQAPATLNRQRESNREWDIFCQGSGINDHVSVFCRNANLSYTQFNTRYWQIRCGTVVAGTPTPTNTPSGPTSTPTPTNTPGPTSTPTNTPTPTATPSGNVVTITNGARYSNTSPQANTTYQCAPGVVLDGQNSVQYAFRGTANGVTIRNCVIQNYATCFNCGAVYSQGTWLITNNEVRNNLHGGIDASGNNTRVIGNNVHHNGQYGIAGGESTGLLIENNDVHFNNTRDLSATFEAGGGKVTVANNVTWRNNRYSHNNGPAMWCDESCRNVVYENNTVWENGWPGIMHEISWNTRIIGNTLTDNVSLCDDSRGGYFCTEVLIFNAGDEDIESIMSGNTIIGNNRHLVFLNHDRFDDDTGDLWATWNYHVFGNNGVIGEWEFICEPEGDLSQAICNEIEASIDVDG